MIMIEGENAFEIILNKVRELGFEVNGGPDIVPAKTSESKPCHLVVETTIYYCHQYNPYRCLIIQHLFFHQQMQHKAIVYAPIHVRSLEHMLAYLDRAEGIEITLPDFLRDPQFKFTDESLKAKDSDNNKGEKLPSGNE